MGIRNAKDAIREARSKNELTQEELCIGICSSASLSRIERGTSGISPSTFQALMERAGAPCQRFPVFASPKDFNCFYTLTHARFYLDAWQLATAWDLLEKAERRKWADNKLYYQEWLLLYSRLQYRSFCDAHDQVYDLLWDALHITRPAIVVSDLQHMLLSQNELQILISLAQEAFYLGKYESCVQICTQIKMHLFDSRFSASEKAHLLAETAVVYTKYLMSKRDFPAALREADAHRRQMAVNTDTAPLLELTFLTGLCHHYMGNGEAAALHIKAAFYSAYAINSSYATVCRNFLCSETDFPLTDYMRSLPDIPLTEYHSSNLASASSRLSAGAYSMKSSKPYTLGRIMQDLRIKQHASQDALCLGLHGKSTLSKIENHKLQPHIMQTEIVLQRLGISERIFTFWGNTKEATFYDLKFKLIHQQLLTKETRKKYLYEMKELAGADNIYRQNYLLFKAAQSPSPESRIATLTSALRLTISDFNIHQIQKYRLSWVEMSLLNNIAHEYSRNGNFNLSTLYFLQMLSYVESRKPDILFQATFLPNTYYMYCHSMFKQKLYQEMFSLHRKLDMSILKSNPNAYGAYLFYYAQALGECARFDDAVWAATQACALNAIMGLYPNASQLKNYFQRDYSLDVDY